MHRPAPARTYGLVVAVLFSFAFVFFASGFTALYYLLHGAHIAGIPGCLFVFGAMLNILGFLFALAGRNLDHIRATTAAAQADSETTQTMFRLPMPQEFVGVVTGRRYGAVSMPTVNSDTTVYRSEPATVEHGAAPVDVPSGAAAQIFEMARRIGRQDVISGDTRS